MADEKKYSPQDVAVAVLAKAAELLAKSTLVKSEQPAKVAAHSSGMHTVEYHSAGGFNKSESNDYGFEPFQKSESMEKATSHAYTGSRDTQTGHEKGVNTHAYLSNVHPNEGVSHAGDWLRTSGSGKRAAKEIAHKKLGELRDMPKPNLPKSEDMNKGTAQPAPSLAMSEKNPDERQDAQLGEDVEGLCERHMQENKGAERKEGHKLVKMEKCSMCKSGMQKSEFAELYEDLKKMEKVEGPDENEIGTKFQKAEGQGSGIKKQPSNEMENGVKEEQAPQRDAQDFETKPGHAPAPDHREAPQAAPGANPHEAAENNNPRAGTVPANKGVDKLRHFHSFMHGKRSMKKGIALG
jgi:hypothetical protein